MRLRNINPIGDVDVPILHRSLKRGEEFDCSREVAELLLAQAGNYEAVKPPNAKAGKTDEKGAE